MKKHLLLLFTALLPLVASAQTKVEIDGIWYNLIAETREAEVTSGIKYSGDITIPATITYEDVTYSVTSIGESAFRGCYSLTAITPPEGVTSIGESAFRGCERLTAITLPENSQLTSIGSGAFFYCSSLTAITIPESVTSIGDDVFAGCFKLTSITIPEGVTSIGIYAFQGCYSLTAITLPEGVTSIGEQAFSGCTSLTAINIPDGVTSIGIYAFRGCSSLTAITIPEGVTSIGEGAFYECSSLTAINIPEGVTSIGDEAFRSCSSLTAVHISNIEAWCKIAFENYGSNPLSHAHNLYLNGELVTNLVIPDGVTSIGNYAFWGCYSLTSITIPEGVTSIGEDAFYDCESLTSITIPEGVTSIGSYAFSHCRSLTAITLPESLTSIGSSAFYDCTSLTSITLPKGVTSIGDDVFAGCSSLKELTLGKELKKIAAGAFSTCEALEKITIHATQPPRIEGEGNALFSDNTYENATLYVPQGCISKYQVMTGWSGFYNISEMEGSTPDYLTLRQADNGEVGIAVDMGRTYKVRITPSTGWKIHTVTFDGKDMTAQLAADNTFTTPTINGSAVLNVAYEKIDDAIESTRAGAIKVQGHQGIISIAGATEGAAIGLYTTSGTLVATATAEGDTTHLTVPTGQVYIVKVADTVVKIGM